MDKFWASVWPVQKKLHSVQLPTSKEKDWLKRQLDCIARLQQSKRLISLRKSTVLLNLFQTRVCKKNQETSRTWLKVAIRQQLMRRFLHCLRQESLKEWCLFWWVQNNTNERWIFAFSITCQFRKNSSKRWFLTKSQRLQWRRAKELN